jgi:rare lipoprotein A
MPTTTWEDLSGTELDRYRLGALLSATEDQAEFSAEAINGEESQPATVTLIRCEPEEAAPLVEEMERAAQLQHPSILRIFGTGPARLAGESYVYLATEVVIETLAQCLRRGPLTKDEARHMLQSVAAGLSYLHGKGLSYGHLNADTTVLASGQWKLGDLSRVGAGAPPSEDVAALGALLRKALPSPPPAPFHSIIEGCLLPDPAKRLTLDEIRSLTEEAPEAHVEEPVRDGPVAYEAPVEYRSRFPLEQPSRFPLRWAVGAGALALAVAGWWMLRPGSEPKQTPAAQIPAPASVSRPAAPEIKPVAPVAETPQPVKKASPFSPPDSKRAAKAPMRAPEPTADRAVAHPVSGARVEEGRADYFSARGNGPVTASGARVNSQDLLAAHARYPFGTKLRVTNLKNGKSVIVRVVDRRSAGGGRVVSVSERAAEELGFVRAGSAPVKVEVVR